MFEDLTKAIEIIEQQYKVGIDYSKGADITALCMVVGKQAEAVIKALSEYLELTKAKAEGRLVVLPCKVGDIVYVVSGCLFYREDAPYTPCEVVVFKQGKQRGVMMHLRPLCEEAAGTRYHRWFPVTSIGKTVFLTREEAEKALEVGE